MAHRSPKELIELYWEQVYNNKNVDLIREICADPMIRHYPGRTVRLSHNEQIARVAKSTSELNCKFSHEVLLADDIYCCSVWNMWAQKESVARMCLIETFKVVDGRLAECWNGEYGYDHWDSEDERQNQVPPAGEG